MNFSDRCIIPYYSLLKVFRGKLCSHHSRHWSASSYFHLLFLCSLCKSTCVYMKLFPSHLGHSGNKISTSTCEDLHFLIRIWNPLCTSSSPPNLSTHALLQSGLCTIWNVVSVPLRRTYRSSSTSLITDNPVGTGPSVSFLYLIPTTKHLFQCMILLTPPQPSKNIKYSWQWHRS